MNGVRHLPAIDGLRALAILGVVGFHAFPGACPGGFAGVDAFFVLSGFLITANLRRELEGGGMSLLAFYERRARRIVPALVALLAVVTVLSLAFLMPEDLERYGKHLIGASASCANVVLYRSTNYFEPVSSLLPLLHTWSLSVEEQFYLGFPLVLMLAHRWARGLVPEALVTLLAVSLVAGIVASPRAPTGSYFLLPTRAWELLMGAVVSWGRLPRFTAPVLRESAAGMGTVMLLATYGVVDLGCAWPGGWALLPCVGTALVVQAVSSGPTWTGRTLAWPPLVGIGLISYSLYLWHWPLLAFNEYLGAGQPHSAPRVLGCVIAAFILAWASWRWVEQPFRTKTSSIARWSRARVLTVSTAALTVLIVIGAGLMLSHGLPRRLPAAVVIASAARNDRNPDNPGFFSNPDSDFALDRLPRAGAAVPASIALIGDSHAEATFAALGEVAAQRQHGVIAYVLKGVPPLMGIEMTVFPQRRRIRHNLEEAITRISHAAGITTVVLAARWAVYVYGERLDGRIGFANRPPHLSDGTDQPGDDLALLRKGLGAAIATLLAGGKQVIVLGAVPEYDFPVPLAFAQALRFGSYQAAFGVSRKAFEHRQEGISDILGSLPAGVLLVSPSESLWDGALFRAGVGATAWYFDDNHLSLTGARRLEPIFQSALK